MMRCVCFLRSITHDYVGQHSCQLQHRHTLSWYPWYSCTCQLIVFWCCPLNCFSLIELSIKLQQSPFQLGKMSFCKLVWSIYTRLNQPPLCLSYDGLSGTQYVPNDSELNCNYSLYRREPTTKPTNRFLCFHTTAVVIALPACLKIISLQGGEGLLLLHENRTGGAHIRNLLVFSLGLPNLWL